MSRHWFVLLGVPCGLAVLATGATQASAAQQPVAQIRPVQDQIGHQLVADNYRWMESGGGEFQAFLHTQTAWADAAIDRIAGRARLEKAIAALDAPGAEIRALTPDGDALFFLRRGAADDVFRLAVRHGGSDAERILVDPEALPDAKPHAEIDQFAPSMDGNYVAYGLEENGPDSSVLRIYDVVRNTTLSERIPGTRFASVAWRPDSTGFYYTRPVALGPGVSVANHLGIFSHRLGTDPAQDELILDSAKLPFPYHKSAAIPRLVVPPGSDNALLFVSDGLSQNLTVATAPVAQLNMAPAPWQLVAADENDVTEVVSAGSVAFLLSSSGAKGGRILSEDLADPGFDHARTVLPSESGVLTGIAAGSDALYIARRQGAAMHLLRLDYNDSAPQEIRLPFDGTIAPVWGAGTAGAWGGLVADPRAAGALFSLESWNHPLSWLHFDIHLRRVADLGLLPGAAIDANRYSIVEDSARAPDGTAIPLSIIAGKAVAMDHARPTLIDAYGSYGYAYDPRFMPQALAWAEEGGVFAVCHVRGGGELGAAWHKGAILANKITAATDLLACAHALRDKGYTDPAHMAAMGTNAGTLAVGNAMVRDPAAFRAVLMRDGLTNPLRGHADIDVLELGSVDVPLQREAVLSIDPYAQIKEGVEYPAALLTGSVTGAQEEIWQTAKLAARLQAASTSGRPVMLRVAFDQAPSGPTRVQRDANWASEMSFLLWQLGDADFMPGAAPAALAKATKHPRHKHG